MLYGDEKVREMARSILPSARRVTARRDAAAVKRRRRRITRQTLHVWAGEVNAYDFEGHIFDYADATVGRGYPGDIAEVVQSRRDGDKLAAMLRWAVKVTAHLDDPVDRRMFMKRVLPDNLIGRHAMSHIVFLDEFTVVHEGDRRYQTVGEHLRAEEARRVRTSAAIESAAAAILTGGGHAVLNRRLREVHASGHIRGPFRGRPAEHWNCTGCDLRLLHGWHDVSGFAAHLVEHNGQHGADVQAFWECYRTFRMP